MKIRKHLRTQKKIDLGPRLNICWAFAFLISLIFQAAAETYAKYLEIIEIQPHDNNSEESSSSNDYMDICDDDFDDSASDYLYYGIHDNSDYDDIEDMF